MRKIILIIVICLLIVIGGYFLTLNSQKISKLPANNQSKSVISQNEINITNRGFSPEEITIKTGSYVTFTNKDSVTHAVIESNKAFNKEIKPGDSFKITFDKSGTFEYISSSYPNMKGKVVVQ